MERKRRASGKGSRRKQRLSAEQFRALAQEQLAEAGDHQGRFALSVRGRFLVLGIGFLLLVTLLTGVGLYGLNQGQSNAQLVLQAHVRPTGQLGTLKALVYETQMTLVEANTSAQGFYLAAASDALDRNLANMNRTWTGVRDSLDSAPEVARVTELNLVFEEYQAAARLHMDSLLRRARVVQPGFARLAPGVGSVGAGRAQSRFTDKQLDDLYAEVILKRFEELNAGLSQLTEQRMAEAGRLVVAAEAENTFRTRLLWLVALMGAAGLVALGYVFLTQTTRSIRTVGRAVRALGQGDLSRRRLPLATDEIGALAVGVHQLTTNLRRIAVFATDIGEGKFKTQFQAQGESDQLGVSLMQMRDRLQEVVEEDRRRNWSVAGFAQFSEILRLSEDEQDLAERVISALAKYIDANQAAFFLLDDEDANDVVLRMAASYAYDRKKAASREFRLGEGFVGQTAVEREPIHVSDIPGDYVTMTSGLGEAAPKSLLIVPLVYNDVVYGVVEFASFDRFQTWEIDFVKRLSETIGAALANLKAKTKTLRLLEESQKLSSELQSQQAGLVEANKRLEGSQKEIQKAQVELKGQISALNNAAIVSEADLEGNITFANDAFLKATRYSLDDVLGRNHRILKSETTPADVFLTMWDMLSRGKLWKGELKNKARDGSTYWVDATITPVLDAAGKVSKYISVQFDITNQKVQEEQIRTALEESMAQEEELRQNAEELEAQQEEMRRTQIELVGQISALNNAAIVSEADLQGRIITVNDAFLMMSKYTREELIGQNHRILKSGHQADDLFERLWKTITSGEVWKGEFKNRAKDGSFYWVTASVTPVIDAAGTPVKYIGVQFDITAQKLQEEQIRAALEISQAQEAELRQNAEELQAAQEEMRKTQIELRGQIGALNNAGIVAETDLRGNITLVNEEFCRISKYPREDLLGMNHRILKSGNHPDKFYDQLWETVTKGQVWHGVFHNRAADGSDYWVKSSITPVLGFDGKPVKYIGVSFDITAQVQSEDRIARALELSQAQESQLRENAQVMQVQQIELDARQTALNNSGLVVETDTQGIITYISENVPAMWGFDREEILGQTHRIVKSGEHDEAFFADMWQTITRGEVWKGEIKNQSKDGTDFWSQLTITPVRDPDGNVLKFIAVSFDITKQKRQASRIRQFLELSQKQEEELRRSAEELAAAQVELKGQISALNNAAIVSETDLQGVLTFVNDEATYLWGYSREELVGQPHSLLKSDHHGPEFFERMWDKLAAGFLWRGEIMNRAKDGSEFWEELTITPVVDAEGKPVKYIGVAFDITKNKKQAIRIRQELKKAEEQEAAFRTQIEELQQQVAAGGGAVEVREVVREVIVEREVPSTGLATVSADYELTVDLYGNIRSANGPLMARLGMGEAEVLRRHFTELSSPGEAHRLNELNLWVELLQQLERTELVVHTDASGKPVPVQYHLQVVLGANGQPEEFLAVGQEVQLGASDAPAVAMSESPATVRTETLANPAVQAQLAAILEQAPVLLLDADGRIQQVSAVLASELGLEADAITGRMAVNWLGRTEELAAAFNRQEPWRGEVTLPAADGPRSLKASLVPVPEANLTFLWLMPVPAREVVEKEVVREVEVIREVEKPVEVLREVIREVATDSTAGDAADQTWQFLSHEAVLSETDARGTILSVNDRFCELSGYSREELLGRNHNIVRAPETPGGLFFDMWATIGRGKRWSGEVMNRAADGRAFWLQLNVLPVLDANGKAERFLGVGFDITRLKRATDRPYVAGASVVFSRPSAPEPTEPEPAAVEARRDANPVSAELDPAQALAIEARREGMVASADRLPDLPPVPDTNGAAELQAKRLEVEHKQTALDQLLAEVETADEAETRERLRRQAFYEEQELRALQIELALLERQHQPHA